MVVVSVAVLDMLQIHMILVLSVVHMKIHQTVLVSVVVMLFLIIAMIVLAATPKKVPAYRIAMEIGVALTMIRVVVVECMMSCQQMVVMMFAVQY